MNKKKYDTHVKCQFAKFMSNMCVVCVHDKDCTLPLHGKVMAGGEPCQYAEHIPDEELMMFAVKNLYGLSPEQCAQFEKKMKEKLHG